MIERGCRNKQTVITQLAEYKSKNKEHREKNETLFKENKAFKLVLEIKQEEQSKLTIPMKKINLLEEFVKLFD